MSTLLLKHADLLVTMDAKRRRIVDGGVFVRDHAIEQVGPTAELPTAADTVIDARGMIVLPGLVNTHHHLYQTLTALHRGRIPSCSTGSRRSTPSGHAWSPRPSTCRRRSAWPSYCCPAARPRAITCTCTRTARKIDDEIQAAVELGIRFTATRGSMSLGESKGGLPPDSCVEEEDDILADSRRAIEQYHQRRAVRHGACGAGAVLALQRHRRPDARERESSPALMASGCTPTSPKRWTRRRSASRSSARRRWPMSSRSGGQGTTSGTRTACA